MYNPSRGGVRGGADQFTWESVKSDKHRENYLGHSLMAPVGRWQKGKDLSWYAKERKDVEAQEKSDKMELASIKRAEEEAMLIALGCNVVRKENQSLSKEDMRDALKRNATQKNENIDKVDGVGASGSSKRFALLSNSGIDFKPPQEGVAFEIHRNAINANSVSNKDKGEYVDEKRSKSKKSKKHKKEKKHKKHHKESDSDSSEPAFKHKVKYKECDYDSNTKKTSESKKHKIHHKESSDSDSSHNILRHRNKPSRKDTDNDDAKSYSKTKGHKKSKHKERNYSSDDSGKHVSRKNGYFRNKDKISDFTSAKRRRHDSSDSD